MIPVLAIADQGDMAVLRIPREQRLAEIERALKLDPDRDYRRELVREYLRIWDEIEHAEFM